MATAFGRLFVGLGMALVVGCGGGGGAPSSSPQALCQGICDNEAKLNCPNGDHAGCLTGCQAVLVQDKQAFPSCADQFDAVFRCTGKVATTSIHCSTTSVSPAYDDGFCSAEVAALASCTACNTVANTAPTIDQPRVADALPTASAAGGTFVPGTYYRTASTEYTGVGGLTAPSGVTQKQTIVISDAGSGGFIAQSVQSTSGAAEGHGNLMGTPAGSTVSLVITCPVSQPFGDFPYTATATSFTLYNTADSIVEVYTGQ